MSARLPRIAADILPPPEPGEVSAAVFAPVFEKLALADVKGGLAEQMVQYLVGRWNGLMLAKIQKHVPNRGQAKLLLYKIDPSRVYLDPADALELEKEVMVVMAQVVREIEQRLPFVLALARQSGPDAHLNN